MSTKLRTPKGFEPVTMTHIVRASSHGSGLHMMIPKETTESLDIEKGDKLFIVILGIKKGEE